MMMHETTVARLLWFAAQGKVEEGKAYAGHILKRGTELGAVRAEIESMMGPGFYFEMLGALPWLAADTFGEIAIEQGSKQSESMEDRISAMLAAAGKRGVRLSALRSSTRDKDAVDEALSSLESDKRILSADVDTGGRPARMFWLAAHAPAHAIRLDPRDPFAFTGDMARARAAANDAEDAVRRRTRPDYNEHLEDDDE